MFKPHYGTCSSCHQPDQLIVVKKGFCQRCNYKLKEKRKKSEGKSYGYKYKRKPTGEKDTFHRVLDNIPDDQPTKCFVCGVLVPVVTHHNMSHILPKSKYPLFRNKAGNIRIMCHSPISRINEVTKLPTNGCHSDFDTKPRSELKHEMWDKVWELEKELLSEYKIIESL